MCKSEDQRSSSRPAKRMKGETSKRDGSPKRNEINDFLRCIQQDLIDQQENSQNLPNQEPVRGRSIERAPGKSSGLAEKAPEQAARRTTETKLEREAEPEREEGSKREAEPEREEESKREPQTSDPKSCLENGQSAALNESDHSDLVSIASSSEGSLSKTKEKISTHLERIQEGYASIRKSIHPKCSRFRPFDCVRPTYLLKEALNSHSLNDIAQLYSLNAKEKSICPYLLSKTGFLLFRKFLELRPEMEQELCSDLVEFVKQVRFLTAMPTAELFLDFLVFCYETGHQRLLEEFGDLNDRVSDYYHLSIKHLKQNFEMFQGLIAFVAFFKEFREDRFDSERYERDEFKGKDFTHICLQLKKLITSPDYDQPLDQLLLCLVDLLILFKKTGKAKRLLFKFYERHPTNLNAVLYILKFNELHLKDPDVFRSFYNRLVQLDPGHPCLIRYLDHICLPVESLKILLSFVDYSANKDDSDAWRLIYTKLAEIEPGSPDETAIREFYSTVFASYWPTYQFTNLSVKINPKNCDFLFHKAYAFHYFQPDRSEKFVSQVKLLLTLTKSDKLELLKFKF